MTNFGLIDQAYDTDAEFDPDHTKTQWERFGNKVTQLNHQSGRRVQYKVLYSQSPKFQLQSSSVTDQSLVGRHGEGYHNVAESFYGTEAWDVRPSSFFLIPILFLSLTNPQCYWSLQPGNATTTWADAHLTPTGEAQALKAAAFWATLVTSQNIPVPQSYYTSPLTRCLDTCNLTFSSVPLPPSYPFKPVIKELFREAIGVHTCDRRSSKSFIRARYPTWRFEEGFSEEDPLFRSAERETDEGMDSRSKKVLDDVFENDGAVWVSISSHSGEIGSILRGEFSVLCV